MSLRFLALLAVPAGALALASIAACSSSSTPDAADAGGDTGPDPFGVASAGASGSYIDKSAACARYVAALNAKAGAIPCKLGPPSPSCPDVLDKFEHTPPIAGNCVTGYDEGTVANCEQRIATYKTCPDFADVNKGCIFSVRVDATGAACGTDAGGDASSDAPTDAPTDAVGDAPSDAPSGETASSDASDGGAGGG